MDGLSIMLKKFMLWFRVSSRMPILQRASFCGVLSQYVDRVWMRAGRRELPHQPYCKTVAFFKSNQYSVSFNSFIMFLLNVQWYLFTFVSCCTHQRKWMDCVCSSATLLDQKRSPSTQASSRTFRFYMIQDLSVSHMLYFKDCALN